MQKYVVNGHKPSLLPDEKKWKLIWNDEFDATELDTSKWYYRLYLGGKRHKTYIEDAISFDGNSNIVFHLVEKDGQYYSSTIQTGENYTDRPNGESKNVKPKFMHKYGYYEVRCKLQKENPWWSAFWIQAPNVAILPNPEEAGVEVDIMESFSPGTYIPHFLHWGGYAENHKVMNSLGENRYATLEDEIKLKETEDGFHIFGMEWNKDGYTFYVDGIQSGVHINLPVSHTEQFVLLFTECKGYRNEIPGYIASNEFGSGLKDEFIVDYVRVFDEIKE